VPGLSQCHAIKGPPPSLPRQEKGRGNQLESAGRGLFQGLAEETGLPYQKLIDLYLLDCAKKRKKLTMKWVA